MNNKIFLDLSMMILGVSSAWAGTARVVITGTMPGSKVSGEALFTEENGGLTVQAFVTGLTPGKHGFHIHENGSCEDAGKAAGGHFNPDKVMHGYMPKDGMGHAHPGDMGNIEADADGKGRVKVFLAGVTLTEGKYAVTGKSIIVHEKEDDFSQPTGSAGGRIGCGIITPEEIIANTKK